MNLEHPVTPEGKGTNKDYTAAASKGLEPSAGGPHWPKMGRFECLRE